MAVPAPIQTDALLSASELRLSFGNQAVLEGATMAIYPGEKVGLVGRNGCGKSSFLRIVAGAEAPDDGTLSRRQGLAIGYLPQDFQLEDDLSVGENIRHGAAELIAKIERFEKGSGLGASEMDRLQVEISHADGWNLESRIETLTRQLSAPP
ncbi:MAG: ABC-F family ATP-binding cassette domain-containing protein, partial [Verrucomicrobiae bacterium]|nr:ABC-F family ATP-binding cassette domain-containing protein [Verrucomicrobiae bacterium]